MKQLLLIAILVSFSLILNSQSRVLLPKEKNNVSVQMDYTYSESTAIEYHQPSEIARNISSLGPNEHILGTTFYDMQAFNSLQNRIHRYDDGSIGAVWTFGVDYNADFPDRGTGYNFYDGNEWNSVPDSRIESIKTGWPSYAPLGFDGEIVVSDPWVDGQVSFSTRDVKGVGDWIEIPYNYSAGPQSLHFHRMITAGTNHNSIHLLSYAGQYMGQPHSIVYSRSQDGGISWNIENVVLEGTGAGYNYEIRPDQYVWAEERAGTLAFLCCRAWGDLFMMKSSDDGDTWEKTVIWENPHPLFNGSYNTEAFFCTDNSANIALDSAGNAHVVFGINRVRYENGYFFYPYIDGIGYWNEDMEPFSNDYDALAPPGTGYQNSEMIEDYNYIGWMQDVDGDGIITLNSDMYLGYRAIGPSCMPSITIDDQDQIFVVYASTTETYEYENFNFKHIWGRAFANGVWGPFIDLTASSYHIDDECIYPVLAFSSDDFIHYIFQADATPGIAVLDYGHNFQETRIIYGALTKYDLIPSPPVNLLAEILDNDVQLSWDAPAYVGPNFTLLGYNIYRNNVKLNNDPIPELFYDDIDVSNGTYFYCVTAQYEIGESSSDCMSLGISVGVSAPEEKKGFSVYPNPVQNISKVRYQLSDIGFVSLQILDVHGKVISVLVDEIKGPGEHSLAFDLSKQPNGLYLVRLQTGTSVATSKIILLK